MIFATHGLPHKLVTDNGPAFISHEFKTFMDMNGIVHIRSALYHPSTNGLAERAVHTFKEGMKHLKEGSLKTHMARFLSKYRLTPHSTTGLSPCEMLLGHRPRSRLDLMHPDLVERVQSNQLKQKSRHDHCISVCSFKEGDTVYVCSFNNVNHWIPGHIVVVTGPLSYKIQMSDGLIIRRHVDHIKIRHSEDRHVCVASRSPRNHLAESTSEITFPWYPSLTDDSSHSSKGT